MNAKSQDCRPKARRAFTLLETLLALFVFSMAVVALVEAINGMGVASVEARQERRIQTRLESLLLDTTRRQEWLQNQKLAGDSVEIVLKENDVTFLIKVSPLELENNEGEPIAGIYAVQIIARWQEAGLEQQRVAETWVWPPLHTPASS